MITRYVRPLAAVVSLLIGWSTARAGEKEWQLALTPAFAMAQAGDGNGGTVNAWGGGAGLDVAYGLNDAIAVRLTGAYSAHALDASAGGPAGVLSAFHAGAGITYAIDVLRLVPYFDLGVGLLGSLRPSAHGTDAIYGFGVEIGLGLDYLATRLVSVGFVVRYHAYLTDIQHIPNYLYAGPRIAFHFGG
jgi:hypothetical protein